MGEDAGLAKHGQACQPVRRRGGQGAQDRRPDEHGHAARLRPLSEDRDDAGNLRPQARVHRRLSDVQGTNVQTATTTITTKNGETIVIGGLVRDVVQEETDGLPLLSSLPIIGSLFQVHSKSDQKEELVIFVTPTLLED